MEKILSDVKLSELKQSDLSKTYEHLHSEASSILTLSLQWKDLAEHFDSIRESITFQYKELEEREKGIGLKEKQLENVQNSFRDLPRMVTVKKDEVEKLNGLIEKYDAEVKLKEKEMDSAEERLKALTRDIELRETDLDVVCVRITDIEKEIELKEMALCMAEKRIEDCKLKEETLNEVIEELSKECDSMEKHVESIRTLLQEHEEELTTKEKHYDEIQTAIRERTALLKLKEKELESIQNMVVTKWKEKRLDFIEKNIKMRKEELDLKEKLIGSMDSKLIDLSTQLEFKESELQYTKRCIEEHCRELDMQEKQLESLRKSTLDSQDQLKLLTRYVDFLEEAVKECSKEWELEEYHPSDQDSFDDCLNELPYVDNQHSSFSVTIHKCFEGLKAKQKHFSLLRRSIEERVQKLVREEREIEIRTEELDKKNVELKLKQNEYIKCLKKFEMVKKNNALPKKLLNQRHEELRFKERQYEEKAKVLDSIKTSTGHARDSVETSSKNPMDDSNVYHLKLKTKELDSVPTNCSNIPLRFYVDGKYMLNFLCERLNELDLIRTELAIAFQISSHSAKLVLDAVKLFYLPTMAEATKLDPRVIKRGCILVLELLLKASPQITLPLKEEALKLAVQWKDKMTMEAENHLEVLAFLLLLANFGLASAFNADELHTLLDSVSHYKQAVQLGQILDIADNSPGGDNVIVMQPKSLPTNVSSLKNDSISKHPDGGRLRLLLNEQLTQSESMSNAKSALETAVDPAKLVLDVVEGSFHRLLKKGEMGFEASRLRWCTHLFEQLMGMSPHICPEVREDAIRLAVNWKSKMGIDRSLENVAFLKLLVSFGLASSFSRDEILKLFENIVDHDEVAKFRAMFGLTHKDDS